MTDTTLSKQSPLERALAVVTEVRAGEGIAALLLALNVCLILTAALILKPVREGLILSMGPAGAEYKSYVGAAIAASLVFAVPAYARYADRVPKLRLVVSVTLFFASHLVLFYLANSVPALSSKLGILFYLWHGIFNMMIVAQFWSLANDLYSVDEGKRLFPLVGIGQTVGAFLGSLVAALLLRVFERYTLMLVSAGLLVASAGLGSAVYGLRKKAAPERAVADKPVADRSGAFQLVFRDRYLALIAAFSVLFTLVNTNGEFMLSKLFVAAASELADKGLLAKAEIGQYISEQYADFYLATNTATVLLQTLVVSRVIKRGGVKAALFVLPVIAFGDALTVAILPVLAVLRIGKVLENSVDYSFNNTARNLLWLPTSTEAKYKAKQAVDSFCVRFGDVSSAGFVLLLSATMGLGVRAFAVLNLVLTGVWLWLVLAISRENARRAEVQPEPEIRA
jgi:ATP:ADP antiporter, AAA family